MEDMAELAMSGSLAARKKFCGAKEGHLEAPNPEQKCCNFMWRIFDRWLMWTEIIVAALVIFLTFILLSGFEGAESEQNCCGLFQVTGGDVVFASTDCSYDVLAEQDGTLTVSDYHDADSMNDTLTVSDYYNYDSMNGTLGTLGTLTVSDYYDSTNGKTYKICNINGVQCMTSSGTEYGDVTLYDCINTLGLNTEYTSDDDNNFIYSDICTQAWLSHSYQSSKSSLFIYGLIVIIMDTFAIIITLSTCQAELGRKPCKEDGCCSPQKLHRLRNIISYYLWCCCCCCCYKKEKRYKCAGRACGVFTWLSTLIFSFLADQAINGYIHDSATSNNINISECAGGDDYILYDVSSTADELKPTASVLGTISSIAFILVIVGFVTAICPVLKCWKEVPEAQAKEWEELVIKEALKENEKYGCCGWRGLCPCCCAKKDGKGSKEVISNNNDNAFDYIAMTENIANKANEGNRNKYNAEGASNMMRL